MFPIFIQYVQVIIQYIQYIINNYCPKYIS